jgi:hypothetical protein
MQLIDTIFCKEEAKIIVGLPLSKYGRKDLLIWRGSSTGEFTVRSAYHMKKDCIEAYEGDCSFSLKSHTLWKSIWGLQIPNSIKMFLWWAYQNILPVKDNLNKRGLDLDPFCMFCKSEQETIMHILWECPSTTDV